MSFDPTLATGTAVAVNLAAAFLWGTWIIALKYLDDYPLDAFFMVALTISLVFVWALGLLVEGAALPASIGALLADDPPRVIVTLLCGVAYVIGLRLSLSVTAMLGVSLSQPILSSINIFIGTAVSIVVGGLPETVPPARIALAAVILFLAVLMSIITGRFRVQTPGGEVGRAQGPRAMGDIWRGLGLALLAGLFIPAYSLGISFGLRSPTQPDGLTVLPTMALMATGAYVGAWLTCGFNLTRRRQWRCLLTARPALHGWSALTGLFHYGGNILQAIAAANLSAAIAWPLGMTAGLWSQLWGLAYGELRGVPRLAYVTLAGAVGLYALAVVLITATL